MPEGKNVPDEIVDSSCNAQSGGGGKQFIGGSFELCADGRTWFSADDKRAPFLEFDLCRNKLHFGRCLCVVISVVIERQRVYVWNFHGKCCDL